MAKMKGFIKEKWRRNEKENEGQGKARTTLSVKGWWEERDQIKKKSIKYNKNENMYKAKYNGEAS